MSDIENWSTTDDATPNQVAPPNGWPEGMTRQNVNNSARAMMGSIRRYFNAAEFVNLYQEPLRVVTKSTDTQILIAGVNVTADFPINRRVQVTDGTTTVSGFVTAASFPSPNTLVTLLLDSGVVQNGANKVLVHVGKTLGKLAFRSVIAGDQLFDVTAYGAVGNDVDDDSAEIQAAIDACEAAGGGTVYFPVGKYRCNTGLTVQVAGIRLLGEGPFNSILSSGSATAYLVTVGDGVTEINGNQIEAMGFTARAGIAATAGGAIFLQKAPRMQLLNLAIWGSSTIASGVPLFRGVDMNGTLGRNFELVFDGLFVQGCLEDGIRIQNASGAFSNIRATLNGRDQILLDTCDFIQMDTVSASASAIVGRYGFNFANTFTPVTPVSGSQHDCTFTNCQSLVNADHCWNIAVCTLTTFDGCMAQFAQNNAGKDGFHLVAISDVQFAGCFAVDNDRHGFSLDGCTRVSVQGCVGTRSSDQAAGGAGIRLNDCNDCLVAANNVSEQTTGASQKYGILVEGTSGAVGANLIEANIARGNITKNFEDISSGVNLWRGNISYLSLPTTVAAATTPIPNLTDGMAAVTGTTTIDNFSGHTHIGKAFSLRFASALTLTHLTGNLLMAGGVSLVVTAGSVVSFAWDGADYREVSRAIA